MTYRAALRRACAAAILASALAWVAPADAERGDASLAMLDRILPGQWQVRARETGGFESRLCLAEGRPLIQLRHPGQACRRFVVQDEANAVSVSYACGPAGSGLTRIRFENEQLLQIEAQGIAQGLPFAFNAEARRLGACTR
ncbi:MULTISPECIES: DUF3617 domain-containing protein [unclassified Novosphingobium]|uniref:DUF3617 domain-containing protein n=1 Tax=Novosphingobium TaxID=165696 RepID=UPI0017E9EFA0|nr:MULTISPECIES: hypothetical protein [unclassified Novosphingobium]NKJ42945.1 hypothetical protein [Novosphingobium sp. SG720]NMN07315.1 hypothetical protein [Novosphingobium sp. SG919]NMN89623.1 hypothetical protein [Novosphingobium sp. SG916]